MIQSSRFEERLRSITPAGTLSYLVAYSGGLDSLALLHLCVSIGVKLRAVHVHHGLQSEADNWVEHCGETCRQLGVELSVIHVDASAQRGDSPEDAARRARYAALEKELRPDECLLTAHHADDQAETFLLQLMRGAGAAGLAAMPEVRTFAKGWHCRPLLMATRQDILEYANSEHLHWIEDPSNKNTDYDRNFLRQNIMPRLQERWPAAAHSISRSASFQQESLELNQSLARIELAAVITADADVLSIEQLQKLDRTRQLNVLRYWLRQRAGRPPSRNVLLQLLNSLFSAAEDSMPLLHWGSHELRRYRQQLYLLAEDSQNYSELELPWDGKSQIQLTDQITVNAVTVQNTGLDLNLCRQNLRLRFRRSGERIQLPGKQHHQDLKKLMQEAGIPPWQRSRIPLLFVDDELACVCGYWLAKPFAARQHSMGWLPVCEQSAH